jgi:CHAT domain-containing protein
MAVVSGRYRGRKRIKKAEEEAKCLRGKYHAADVAAELGAVTNCLRGQPLAEAIHFALHGHYSPEDRRQDGLLLVDGMVLEPAAVAGHTLDQHADHRPLVFLNACQVGTGEAVLGVYTGMGGAFLIAGAAAVIAPLWSVDDDQASIALSFYEQVLEHEVPPAEFVRRLRAGFRHDADVVDATPLAYQFFGHPQLKIVQQRIPS